MISPHVQAARGIQVEDRRVYVRAIDRAYSEGDVAGFDIGLTRARNNIIGDRESGLVNITTPGAFHCKWQPAVIVLEDIPLEGWGYALLYGYAEKARVSVEVVGGNWTVVSGANNLGPAATAAGNRYMGTQLDPGWTEGAKIFAPMLWDGVHGFGVYTT